jgi:hypothetical protein
MQYPSPLGCPGGSAIPLVAQNGNSRSVRCKIIRHVGMGPDVLFRPLINPEHICDYPSKVIFKARVGFRFGCKDVAGSEAGNLFVRRSQLVNLFGDPAHLVQSPVRSIVATRTPMTLPPVKRYRPKLGPDEATNARSAAPCGAAQELPRGDNADRMLNRLRLSPAPNRTLRAICDLHKVADRR